MEITVINRTTRTMTDLSVELSVTGSFNIIEKPAKVTLDAGERKGAARHHQSELDGDGLHLRLRHFQLQQLRGARGGEPERGVGESDGVHQAGGLVGAAPRREA